MFSGLCIGGPLDGQLCTSATSRLTGVVLPPLPPLGRDLSTPPPHDRVEYVHRLDCVWVLGGESWTDDQIILHLVKHTRWTQATMQQLIACYKPEKER